jgi:hypothetical protein
VLVMPRLKQVDHVKNEKNILKARRGSSNRRGGGSVANAWQYFSVGSVKNIRSVRKKKYDLR